MDVAGAALHRIAQNDVHKLDDRSFVSRLLQFRQAQFLLFTLQFDVFFVQLRHRLHHRFEVFFLGRSVGLINPRENRTLRGYDRFDIEPGHELDVVHGEDVRRIDHGDGERCAHAAQRKDLVTLRGFERNQLDDGGINFEIRKVDGGHAILARKEVGDVFIGQKAELHQRRPQPAALLLLNFGRLFQLLWCDDFLFYEKITQPLRHTQIS